MDEYIAKRKEKQPLEYPSLGSTFKRGEGFITSQVIDEAGLKGYQVAVIEHVKKTVFNKFGFEIKPEVRIIGDEGLNEMDK